MNQTPNSAIVGDCGASLRLVRTVGASGLVFYPNDHLYELDGKRVPGVTSIPKLCGLDGYKDIPADILEHKRQIGVAVHQATAYLDEGTLDEASVDPAIVGYVNAYREFRRLLGYVVVENEKMVVSRKWRFAGQLDRVVERLPGELILLDLKCTATLSPLVRLQTAGYQIAYEEMTRSKIAGRAAVLLREDGSYDAAWYEDRNDKETFLAALKLAGFCLETKIGGYQTWKP